MAKRLRDHRQVTNPGYDESRPSSAERKKQHRATRHAAHQMLHTVDDPDEVLLPRQKRTGNHENGRTHVEPGSRRFKLWKTKFWKRRDDYQTRKAEFDSEWPVITPNQLPHE